MNKHIYITGYSFIKSTIILIGLMLCICPFVFGQDSSQLSTDSSQWHKKDRVYKDAEYFSNIPVEKAEQAIDTQKVSTFISQLKKKYQSDDFNYNEKKINALSWWDRVKTRILAFLSSLLPNYHFNIEKLFYRILIGIGLLSLAYILYRLFTKGQKLTYKEEKEQAEVAIKEIEKKLMDVNLDILLEKALNKKDFISAIRYLHLINLKILSQKNFIQWNYKKTNREFLSEIKDAELQQRFATTIQIYEYSWYGHFTVKEDDFKKYKQQFETFKNQVEHKQTNTISSPQKPTD